MKKKDVTKRGLHDVMRLVTSNVGTLDVVSGAFALRPTYATETSLWGKKQRG